MHKKLQHGIDAAPAIYYRGALPLVPVMPHKTEGVFLAGNTLKILPVLHH